MNEMKFDWDDLRLFLAVARNGGLAAAAAVTGKSAPTLGRRMLALERRLGRELFLRLPRGYALTPDGQGLLDEVVTLEDHIGPMVETDPAAAMPVVKVSAGLWVTHLLCQRVAEIVAGDRIRLRFIASDERMDIGRREALIGVRNQRPDGLGLAGRRIAKVRFAVYACDAAVTTWARVLGPTPSAKWVEEVAPKGDTIEVTSSRNALDLALSGAARAVLPCFIGRQYAGLREVLPPIDALEHDQWLVTHHEDRFTPEVRKVNDRIYAILRKVGAAG